jgi:hypothetical protein
VVEQRSPVTEEDRYDDGENLVEPARLETLTGDVGAQHVHVAVTGGGFGRRQPGEYVGHEEDAGGVGGRVMSDHVLRPVPAAAEGFAGVLVVLVRIVAAVRRGADQQGADVADQLADQRVRAQMCGEPGHVAAGTGDVAVERHGDGVQDLGHRERPSGVVFPMFRRATPGELIGQGLTACSRVPRCAPIVTNR